METVPPPRHLWSNVFIWADGLSEGANYYSSIDNMRAGLTCDEGQATYRVRLIPAGTEPVVYRKVWWDDEKADDTVYAERPGSDPEDDYIINPIDYTEAYPSKVMDKFTGGWYFVDWQWRDVIEPEVVFSPYPQDTYDVDLFERVWEDPDPPFTEWNNISVDQNVQFECLVKLEPFAQDVEVDDHPMCPHHRVKVEIEVKKNPDGSWFLYVVEHYFVEA